MQHCVATTPRRTRRLSSNGAKHSSPPTPASVPASDSFLQWSICRMICVYIANFTPLFRKERNTWIKSCFESCINGVVFDPIVAFKRFRQPDWNTWIQYSLGLFLDRVMINSLVISKRLLWTDSARWIQSSLELFVGRAIFYHTTSSEWLLQSSLNSWTNLA